MRLRAEILCTSWEQPPMSALPPPAVGAPRAASPLLEVEESLGVQSLLLTLARLVKTAVAIAVPIVLVRTFDETTWGHYKAIGLISGTALAVLGLGVPASLYYFVPRAPRASQSLLVRSLVLLALAGLCGGAALAVAGGSLERWIDVPLAGGIRLLLAAIVALSVPAALGEVVAVVDRRARLAAAAVSLLELVRSLLIVALAVTTGRLDLVLAAVLAGHGMQLAWTWLYLAWRGGQRPDDRERFATLAQLRYTLPFFGGAMIALGREQLHAFWVLTQYSAREFGIYAVGTMSIPFIDKLTQSVAEVVVLDAAKRYEEGDLDAIRRVWWRATGAVALALLPVWAAFEVFAPEIIVFITGDEVFRPAARVFRVFVLMLLMAIPLSSALLRASASLQALVLADLASLVATIGVLLLAASPLGAVGAVLSLIAGSFVFNVVAGARIARSLGLGLGRYLQWGRLGGIAAISLAAAGVAALAVAPLPLALRAVGGPALALTLAALVLWLTPLVTEPERGLVRRARLAAWRRLARAEGSENRGGG
jgi:O-antigen/teichoic acid export membrane protein